MIVVFRFFILLVCIAYPSLAYADGAAREKECYRSLSGVWELVDEISNQSSDTFSWGKSPYSMGALLVDFGVKEPYISANGQQLIVDTIDEVAKNQFVIHWHDLEFNDSHPIPSKSVHQGVLVIYKVKENKIWIDWKTGIREGAFAVGSDRPYYRTGGPQ